MTSSSTPPPSRLLYKPGTNWNYAHTNYVLLGMAIEKATGKKVQDLLSDKVLRPLGLTNTVASLTAEIPSPVLHAFTSERRQALGIPAATPFYEDSTFWNPSWTITHGAIQTTNIYDLEADRGGHRIRQAVCAPSRTSRWCPPTCAARLAPSPAAPPAWR